MTVVFVSYEEGIVLARLNESSPYRTRSSPTRSATSTATKPLRSWLSVACREKFR